MAATNKCLAQNNKSRAGGKATKGQPLARREASAPRTRKWLPALIDLLPPAPRGRISGSGRGNSPRTRWVARSSGSSNSTSKPSRNTEAILRQVWLLREVPPDVCKRLDLPSRDEGIDLIACTNHGEYWAIQSKFRSQRYKPLNRRELGTFSSLAFNTCSNIALAVVAHTCSKPVSKRHLMRNTVEIGLDRWQSLDQKLGV